MSQQFEFVEMDGLDIYTTFVDNVGNKLWVLNDYSSSRREYDTSSIDYNTGYYCHSSNDEAGGQSTYGFD